MHGDNKKKKVLLLSTGGTIEKTYDEREGSLANRKSVIEEILAQKLRLPYVELEIEVLMGKDSLHMTDEDRELIFQSLKAREDKSALPIMVLHGTDTMVKTANHCLEQFKQAKVKLKAPIVFTGAMRPIEFENTDAIQNITESLMALQILSPGIYLVFHGRMYTLPHVQKNPKIKTFEQI